MAPVKDRALRADRGSAGAGEHNLALAFELADIADEIAISAFRASGLAVEIKPDGSPVSEADRAIERAQRARLAEARPEHAIVGEEQGGSADAEYCWYLDPIDGTAVFVSGEPEWYGLIALVRDGVPLIGVASAPGLGVRWWAQRGEGAFRNDRRMRVSATARLAEATVSDDWRGTLERRVPAEPLMALAAGCGSVRARQGHAFLAVMEGACDVALGVGGFSRDYAPMSVLIEEAGGRFTDLAGSEAFDSGDALVSNGLIHEQALALLADRA